MEATTQADEDSLVDTVFPEEEQQQAVFSIGIQATRAMKSVSTQYHDNSVKSKYVQTETQMADAQTQTVISWMSNRSLW